MQTASAQRQPAILLDDDLEAMLHLGQRSMQITSHFGCTHATVAIPPMMALPLIGSSPARSLGWLFIHQGTAAVNATTQSAAATI